MSQGPSAMISVLILTKNEERDLPGALASVAWSDDVHVFDSCSTDATVEIARAAGAQVHSRAFDDYATQRNEALRVAFKHPWVFLLDADERPTAELCAEMQRVVGEAQANTAGFRLRRRDYLFGRWLKHAQLTPFYIRLVRPERARYTRAINEVLEVDGTIAELAHPLDHYPVLEGVRSLDGEAQHLLDDGGGADRSPAGAAESQPAGCDLGCRTSTRGGCTRRRSSTGCREDR